MVCFAILNFIYTNASAHTYTHTQKEDSPLTGPWGPIVLLRNAVPENYPASARKETTELQSLGPQHSLPVELAFLQILSHCIEKASQLAPPPKTV